MHDVTYTWVRRELNGTVVCPCSEAFKGLQLHLSGKLWCKHRAGLSFRPFAFLRGKIANSWRTDFR